MTGWQDVIWWSLMVLGLIGSALYSGLETGVYRVNRIRLQVLDHRQNRRARILQRLVSNPVTLLSTLLIGNNLANYIGTASLAVILERQGYNDWQVIVLNVLLLTPLLLIFGETLPKDLFAAHSDRLTYSFAPFLEASHKLFWWCGLLPLTEAFGGLVSRLLRLPHGNAPFHPRRQVEMMVKEGVGHGLISDEQSAIVERVLELSTRTVGDEMVAWRGVIKLSADDPPASVWELADRTSHSRFPLVDSSGSVVGLLSVYDVLTHDRVSCPPLRQLANPAARIDYATPLRDALTVVQRERAPMAVVTRHNKPVGIVTIKDLVEPITGELASW